MVRRHALLPVVDLDEETAMVQSFADPMPNGIIELLLERYEIYVAHKWGITPDSFFDEDDLRQSIAIFILQVVAEFREGTRKGYHSFRQYLQNHIYRKSVDRIEPRCDGRRFPDVIADIEEPAIFRRELIERTAAALERFTSLYPSRAQALQMRFVDECTLAETGDARGVTRERARQLEISGKERFAEMLARDGFDPVEWCFARVTAPVIEPEPKAYAPVDLPKRKRKKRKTAPKKRKERNATDLLTNRVPIKRRKEIAKLFRTYAESSNRTLAELSKDIGCRKGDLVRLITAKNVQARTMATVMHYVLQATVQANVAG